MTLNICMFQVFKSCLTSFKKLHFQSSSWKFHDILKTYPFEFVFNYYPIVRNSLCKTDFSMTRIDLFTVNRDSLCAAVVA